VRSRQVINECELAVKQGVPVYVALGQRCAIPAFLRASNRYDARSRFDAAMAALARDLEGCSGPASRAPAGGLPWAELPVAFALAVMILTLLLCTAIAISYFLSLFTPFANATLVQTSSLRLTTERSYVILEVVSFLASAGIGAACAWALARRRWRLSFAAWLSVALLVLFAEGIKGLPLASSEIRLDGGAGSQALSSAFLVLARASVVLSLLIVPTLMVLAGSVAVLRGSRTGAGSPVARMRLHGRSPGYVASVVGLGAEMAKPETLEELEPGLFADASQQLSFQVDAASADHKLEAALTRACEAAGMLRACERADRHLLLLTNANAGSHQALRETLSHREVPPIIVLGCSLPFTADDQLVRRYQWIDFRRGKLGPDTAGQLAGRSPLTALPMAVPASPDTFRAPLGVGLGVWTSRIYGFYFALIAAINLYPSQPDSGINLPRIALALILAVNMWAFYRLIVLRRTRFQVLRFLFLSASGASILYGILSLLATGILMVSKVYSVLIGFSLPIMLWTSLSFVGTHTAWLPDEAAALPRQPALPPAVAGQLPLILILVKVICAVLHYVTL